MPTLPTRPEPRRPPRVAVVSKPGGGRRALVRLDPRDAERYARAVADVTSRIERVLRSGVLANRSLLGPRGAMRLRPWRPARRGWERAIARIASGEVAAVVRADVVDCYGSMGEREIRLILGANAAPALDVLGPLWDMGVRGLPIGPEASAVVANAVLAAVDDAVAWAGGAPLRWVDDWVIPVRERRAAGRVLLALEHSLGELGLELHLGKTEVLLGRQAIALGLAGHTRSGLPRMP